MQKKSRPWLPDAGVLLLFVLLTIVAAWPLLMQLDSLLIGADNDVAINPWADWWTAKVLHDPDLSLWWTDYLYYPQGVTLSYHSFSHWHTLLSLGMQRFIGVIPAYNLAVLLNFPLAGLAMFQLARYLTRSRAAGIIAGIVFAFNSHNLYQSAHPVLVSVWCFPWSTLFYLRAVREQKVRWALLTALFVFLGALTSTLLLMLLGLWLTALTLYLYGARHWPRPSLSILLIAGGGSIAASLLLLLPLLREALLDGNSSFLITARQGIVMDIVAPLIPHWWLWLQRGIYVGIVPLLLLMVAAWRGGRDARLWFGLLATAYLLAIGPYPVFWGRALPVTLPWSLPIVPLLRNPYRLNILFSFGLAMLVAYGWLAATRRLTDWRRLAAALLCGLLIFGEYNAASFPVTRLPVSEFYTQELRGVPEDIALGILPHGRQENKRYLYDQTIHGHKLINGIVSRSDTAPMAFINSNALLRAGAAGRMNLPQTASGQLLQTVTAPLGEMAAANIGYLIFYKPFDYTEQIPRWRDWLTFQPIYEDEQLLVYRTDPRFGRDFSWRYPLTAELGLIGAEMSPTAVIGEELEVDLRWGSRAAPARETLVCLQLQPSGGPAAERHCAPLQVGRPSSSWTADEIVHGYYAVPLGDELEPGSYQLMLFLTAAESGEQVGETAVIGTFQLLPE